MLTRRLNPRRQRQRLLMVAASSLAIPAAATPFATSQAATRDTASSSCLAGFSQCQPQGQLPANFCCPSDSRCVVLAANTTALCCPSGNDCRSIEPISCYLSLQDAAAFPEALVKTIALSGSLSHCGDGTCCPFGYSCRGGTACVMDADQDVAPSQRASSSSTSTSSSITASVTTSSAPVAVSDANPSGTAAETEKPKHKKPVAVIAGLTAAAVVAILVFVGAFLISERRHRRTENEHLRRAAAGRRRDRDGPATPSSSRKGPSIKATRLSTSSSFGNIISNPIVPAGDPPLRSDFARKAAPSGATLSPPSSSAAPTSVPPIREMRPQSTFLSPLPPVVVASGNGGGGRSLWEREPSSFSIDVFADPASVGSPTRESGVAASAPPAVKDQNSRRYSHMTTFSDMLRSADLGGLSHGEPFVPASVQGTPTRKR
ncbi:hypothetical protein VTK73DRAFT_8420 [Phialemonium thermophilum]|uniref:Uncharacterized protein n=1 Tax=Phialemonium thermophilum TaxID=223376 RepID=A0ABR3W9D2_9PEZI